MQCILVHVGTATNRPGEFLPHAKFNRFQRSKSALNAQSNMLISDDDDTVCSVRENHHSSVYIQVGVSFPAEISPGSLESHGSIPSFTFGRPASVTAPGASRRRWFTLTHIGLCVLEKHLPARSPSPARGNPAE